MQNDIRTLVDEFTTQLEQTIRRMALEQVEAALGGMAGSAPRRGPGRPRNASNAPSIRRAVKGSKRDSASLDEMSAALLAHVKANPGQRGEQIAMALGTDVGTMRLPMKKLIAARAVRTEGQRRGMMYFAGARGGAKKAARASKKAGKRKAKRETPKAEAAAAE